MAHRLALVGLERVTGVSVLVLYYLVMTSAMLQCNKNCSRLWPICYWPSNLELSSLQNFEPSKGLLFFVAVVNFLKIVLPAFE